MRGSVYVRPDVLKCPSGLLILNCICCSEIHIMLDPATQYSPTPLWLDCDPGQSVEFLSLSSMDITDCSLGHDVSLKGISEIHLLIFYRMPLQF